jgi:hypothetical protein
LPLFERKALLEPIVAGIPGLQFNGHEIGDGELVRRHACQLGFEGIVSKTAAAPYASGNRGLWRKAKCLNRQEFVVVGWTNPGGSRPHLGALLLGYYTDDGKLVYAGRVGTGMSQKVLKDLRRRLDSLARPKSPLIAPPARTTRFGSPLVLSRVHWVEPKLVAEITYLTWTADNLLRHAVYGGLREDKPPSRCGASSKSAGREYQVRRRLTLHGNAQDSRADAPGGDRQRSAKARRSIERFCTVAPQFPIPLSSLVALHLPPMGLPHDRRQIACNMGGLSADKRVYFDLEILRQQFAHKHRFAPYLHGLHVAPQT